MLTHKVYFVMNLVYLIIVKNFSKVFSDKIVKIDPAIHDHGFSFQKG